MSPAARLPKPPSMTSLPIETRKKLKEMDRGQLECGLYHFHAYVYTGQYRPYNPGEHRGVQNIMPLLKLEQECERCHVIRTDTFNARTLERVGSPTYDRPQTWVEPGIPRGVKPSLVYRQEAYRRTMERVAHAEPGQRATADR